MQSSLLRRRTHRFTRPSRTSVRVGEFVLMDIQIVSALCGIRVKGVTMEWEADFLPVGEGERSGDAIAVRFAESLSGPPAQRLTRLETTARKCGAPIVRAAGCEPSPEPFVPPNRRISVEAAQALGRCEDRGVPPSRAMGPGEASLMTRAPQMWHALVQIRELL